MTEEQKARFTECMDAFVREMRADGFPRTSTEKAGINVLTAISIAIFAVKEESYEESTDIAVEVLRAALDRYYEPERMF